jgi:hypothetical protein
MERGPCACMAAQKQKGNADGAESERGSSGEAFYENV